jgi:hypothetical protein
MFSAVRTDIKSSYCYTKEYQPLATPRLVEKNKNRGEKCAAVHSIIRIEYYSAGTLRQGTVQSAGCEVQIQRDEVTFENHLSILNNGAEFITNK